MQATSPTTTGAPRAPPDSPGSLPGRLCTEAQKGRGGYTFARWGRILFRFSEFRWEGRWARGAAACRSMELTIVGSAVPSRRIWARTRAARETDFSAKNRLDISGGHVGGQAERAEHASLPGHNRRTHDTGPTAHSNPSSSIPWRSAASRSPSKPRFGSLVAEFLALRLFLLLGAWGGPRKARHRSTAGILGIVTRPRLTMYAASGLAVPRS
jgi:hypothetical protein